ncbi:hypothetical protein Nm8I071_22920 [Nonomuraea sp. TT08I-71]|nr:hypothetical protein Nm8I071_22920 [Nonomuraea sp. TT08I-71]
MIAALLPLDAQSCDDGRVALAFLAYTAVRPDAAAGLREDNTRMAAFVTSLLPGPHADDAAADQLALMEGEREPARVEDLLQAIGRYGCNAAGTAPRGRSAPRRSAGWSARGLCGNRPAARVGGAGFGGDEDTGIVHPGRVERGLRRA